MVKLLRRGMKELQVGSLLHGQKCPVLLRVHRLRTLSSAEMKLCLLILSDTMPTSTLIPVSPAAGQVQRFCGSGVQVRERGWPAGALTRARGGGGPELADVQESQHAD